MNRSTNQSINESINQSKSFCSELHHNNNYSFGHQLTWCFTHYITLYLCFGSDNYDANVSDISCLTRCAFSYWQYGSIPVAEYNGKATFPKDFILRRSYLNGTSLPSDESLLSLRLEQPLAGTWFFGALVEKQDDQVIKKVFDILLL